MIGERNPLFNFVFLKKVGTGGGKSANRGVKMQKSKKKNEIRGITISFASPALRRVRSSFVDTLFPVPEGSTSTCGRPIIIIIIYYSNQMSE